MEEEYATHIVFAPTSAYGTSLRADRRGFPPQNLVLGQYPAPLICFKVEPVIVNFSPYTDRVIGEFVYTEA